MKSSNMIFASLLAAAAFAAGCSRDALDLKNACNVTVYMQTDCAELITKAGTLSGEDELNENLIKNIHYYMFDPNDGTFLKSGSQVVNKTASATVSLSGIDQTEFNQIFNGRSSVDIFLAANITGDPLTLSATSTVEDVKEHVISLAGHGKQSMFVMTGGGVLSNVSRADIYSAGTASPIELKRVASKTMVHLHIKNSFTKDDKTYVPEFGQIKLKFNRVEANATLGGLIGESESSLSDLEFKSVSNHFEKSAYDSSSETWSLTAPVYSYPRAWLPSSLDIPFIYITLPWTTTSGGGSTTTNTYYKVVFPGYEMGSNCWYDITVNLEGLGSLVPEEAVTIDNLKINLGGDWKDALAVEGEHDTEADIAIARVLAVDVNEYTLYNEAELVIPFVSSHDCDYTFNLIQDSRDNARTSTSAEKSISVNNTDKTLTFTHTLENDQSKTTTGGKANYDYREYICEITLKHADDASYNEVIRIVQKPALCVTSYHNEGHHWNVFVYGYQKTSTSTTSTEYKNKFYQLGGSATNHDVYQVTASVLPSTGSLANFIIGDPRVRTNQKGTSPYSSLTDDTKYDVKGTQRALAYYYPADGSNSDNIISPSFRIASAYGGIGGSGVTYTNAQKRCASYQEAGYPAGRWRLPTAAELVYCGLLQKHGCLTDSSGNSDIFKSSTNYWCANGKLYKDGVQNGTSGSVRCVYDAWYWDKTDYPRLASSLYETNQSSSVFRWGDEQVIW